MGLDLLAGEARECLEDDDLWIFASSGAGLDRAPMLFKIWSSFYRDGRLRLSEVEALRDELGDLVRQVGEEMLRRRGVRTLNPELRARILRGLRVAPGRLSRLHQLHAFVARAAADGYDLRWSAD